MRLPANMLVTLLLTLSVVEICVWGDQSTFNIVVPGENENVQNVKSIRNKRMVDKSIVGEVLEKKNISSVFHLNDSHLHLMVHWAGKGSSIVFCLARDQEMNDNSTSRLFVSQNYGTTFLDISERFTTKVTNVTNMATISKFFHHPDNNCYYVFTDTIHKHIFVTLDCGETVKAYQTQFSPVHVEFDENQEGRFLVHDREGEKRELFVTPNYGETFNHVGDFVKSFYWDSTELYISRLEPNGLLNILSSKSWFVTQSDTRVVFNGATEFEKKGEFLFAVTEDRNKPGSSVLHVGRAGEKFVVSEFPILDVPMVNYYVAHVTEDDGLMVVVNHGANHSNLYVSDVVSQYQVKFSLSLERIMYYNKDTTWRNSWLEKLQENSKETNPSFADFYQVTGLKGVYIASQLEENVTENNLHPSNLTTLITFDGGAEWNLVQGPKTDRRGSPIPGCYQDDSCSLHIAQQLARKYPSTRSIPLLTSKSAPGIILASGNMGQRLGYKTSVFLSADAGLSWHQILKGNYYYNVGDHGGVIVAVKYFKTEGDTNSLLYSTDEGLTWTEHQFYPTPIRIFGLITEPGENTTIFTMFGTDPQKGANIDWIIVKVDLSSVFKRNCTDQDYKNWSPASPGQGKESRCILGRREIFRRRAPLANCFNGLDFTQVTIKEDCQCLHADYQCDFGFMRDHSGQESACIENPEFELDDPHGPPANCPPGSFYNQTKGYQKVGGDQCSGGLDTRYEPEQRSCPVDLTERMTFMLIAQRRQIVKLDLTKANSTLEKLPLLDIHNVIAMDFDYETDCVFWADIDKDRIMKQCLNDSSPPRVLAQSRLVSVEGMSYDHISKILYFVDGSRKSIELVNVNEYITNHQNLRKTVLHKNILGEKSKPRGLVVHPTQGYLFYSDWADKAACIGRSHLDGSNHTIIIDKDKKTGRRILGWPNGLTVDKISERVYFVDAQKDFLASCNLDGGDLKKIVSSQIETSHPFAVAVYKGIVLWNDWTRKAIYQADKNTGDGIILVQDNVRGAMDMKVYSSALLGQRNACSNNTCSHLCIAMPPNSPLPSYTCLCPDGMKYDGNHCLCPDGQVPLANGTCLMGVNGTCSDGQFECSNGLCVAQSWRCDGTSDCGDNSDEHGCQADQCQDNQFQCENNKCVPQHWLCDFDNDCGDGSDERDCPTRACQVGTEFQCKNGQCINQKWKCDLEKDCQDGSDEFNCAVTDTECDSSQLQCKTGGACLPQSWKCDGDVDCPDGSDEDSCDQVKKCQSWQFQCENGHCIFQTWKCDGDHDCIDFSDEKDCDQQNSTAHHIVPEPNFPKGECNEWMFKCASEQCIPYWWKCDGVEDCADGSDEDLCGPVHKPSEEVTEQPAEEPSVVGCPTGKFQCHNGDCIWAGWVCDGENDCPVGEDEEEALCKDKVICGLGQFQCGLSGACVGLESYCDGVRDCQDGTDESGCSQTMIKPQSDQELCDWETSFSCDLGTNCVMWRYKCDGHLDCRDGVDEEECHHWQDQVVLEGLEVDEDERTTSSLLVVWRLRDNLSDGKSELAYKYSHSIHHQNHWINETNNWDSENHLMDHLFGHLQPATDYDLRVFVKNTTDTSEFTHAPVVTARTRDGVPSQPRDVSMVQTGESMIVRWSRPASTNGTIQKYIIRVYQGLNMIQERDKMIDQDIHNVDITLTGLNIGTEYQVDIVAVNQESHSLPSSRAIAKMMTSKIGDLVLVVTGENNIVITWTVGEFNMFIVSYKSDNPLDSGSKKTVGKEGRVNITGLSPNTKYMISVTAILDLSRSASSDMRVTTKGQSLPVPRIDMSGIGLHADSPTTVKLSWNVEMGDNYKNLQFGVWYGVSESGLISSVPRVTTHSLTATLSDLTACTDLLFVVAVFDSVVGIGKMSNIVSITTKYSPIAAPRNLTVSQYQLHWSAPCDRMDKKVSYQLHLIDINLPEHHPGHETWITLSKVWNTTLSHRMVNLTPGSKYKITVSVDVPDASPSNSVIMEGPQIPTPTSVYAHPTDQGYEVSWAIPDKSVSSYEVILTPDPKFINQTCSLVMPVNSSPLLVRPESIFNQSVMEICKGETIFIGTSLNVAVRSVTKAGYKSAFSRAGEPIFALERRAEEGTITIPESSAIGTIVGVVVVMLMLGAGIAYYAFSNRRMRSRFREFTASHYSRATGNATINQLIDEDDDSPIIRGFSDNEPLVMS